MTSDAQHSDSPAENILNPSYAPLLNELKEILARLKKCFSASATKLSPETKVEAKKAMPSGFLPQETDLRRFVELTRELHIGMGRKSSKNVRKRLKTVDERWPGLHLLQITQAFVDRFIAFHLQKPSIMLRLSKLELDGRTEEHRRTLYAYLTDYSIQKGQIEWRLYDPWLNQLVGDDINHVAPSSFKNADSLAWIKFVMVQRELLAWRAQNEKTFNHVAAWVYHLQDDELLTKLSKVVWNPEQAITHAQVSKLNTLSKNKWRVQRHREK